MDLTVDHPSDTAQKYLQEHVKTLVGTSAIFPFLSKYFYLLQQEEELPIGSHLRCRRILEGVKYFWFRKSILKKNCIKLRGHKQSRKDLEESFANFYAQTKGIAKYDVKPATCSGVISHPGKFNR